MSAPTIHSTDPTTKARFLAPGTHQRADAKGKGKGQGALPAKGPTKTTKGRATEPASSAEGEAFAAGDLVLIPLSRVVPPLYEFRVRSRIFRWYGQLRRLEDSLGERPTPDLLQELDGLEDRAGKISVPLSYADELYSLRSHIHMVRRRLQSSAPHS